MTESSLPYHPYLIESLREDPHEAATYLEVCLADNDEYMPTVNMKAIQNVFEALGDDSKLDVLSPLLSTDAIDVLHHFVQYLTALGLEMHIGVANADGSDDSLQSAECTTSFD